MTQAIRLNVALQNRPRSDVAHRREEAGRLAHQRLDQVFAAAPAIPFDDTSRIVLFSDCHRGDQSRADAFAPNENLFLYAMRRYEQRGFTYVEAGDGDELWQNRRFETVQRAHPRVHELFHRLHLQERLHLLLGNHDIQISGSSQVDKGGLLAREGLILKHAQTGQQIFVLHGHQADRNNDSMATWSRLTVRALWKPVLLLGLAQGYLWTADRPKRSRLEQQIVTCIETHKLKIEHRLIEWVKRRRQMIICGHTHRPVATAPGMPPYFNTGNCVMPGQITGIEIENGCLIPIQWSINGKSVQYHHTGRPCPLNLLSCA